MDDDDALERMLREFGLWSPEDENPDDDSEGPRLADLDGLADDLGNWE